MVAQASTRPAEFLRHGVRVVRGTGKKSFNSGIRYAIGITDASSVIHLPRSDPHTTDIPVDEFMMLWESKGAVRLLAPHEVCDLAIKKPKLFTSAQRRTITTALRDEAVVLNSMADQLEQYHVRND